MPLRFLLSNFWRFYSDKTLLAISVLGLVVVFVIASDMKSLTCLVILAMAGIALSATVTSYLKNRRQDGAHIDDNDVAVIYLCKYRVFWRFFRIYTVIALSLRRNRKRRIRLERGQNRFACFVKHKNGYYYPYSAHWSSLDFYQSGEVTMFGNWGTRRRVELAVTFTRHSSPLYELGVHTAITQDTEQFYARPVGKSAVIGVHSGL